MSTEVDTAVDPKVKTKLLESPYACEVLNYLTETYKCNMPENITKLKISCPHQGGKKYAGKKGGMFYISEYAKYFIDMIYGQQASQASQASQTSQALQSTNICDIDQVSFLKILAHLDFNSKDIKSLYMVSKQIKDRVDNIVGIDDTIQDPRTKLINVVNLYIDKDKNKLDQG